ncbi:MAG TPA: hypothetical protein VGH49_15850 [Xanthobacteraceae bacterium]|jgi:hypothetical protein
MGAAAALAAILLLRVPPATAGEVYTSDCLHGSSDRYSFAHGQEYGGEYGSEYGDSGSRGYSYSRESSGGIRTGFIGRSRREFGGGPRTASGGGSSGESNAGYNNGHSGGYSNETGVGSSRGDHSDSCVEIRHELTNPYVIRVQAPQTPEEIKAFEEHDRLWRDRCRPVVRQDMHGVSRYAYSAPGCEYGKYE